MGVETIFYLILMLLDILFVINGVSMNSLFFSAFLVLVQGYILLVYMVRKIIGSKKANNSVLLFFSLTLLSVVVLYFLGRPKHAFTISIISLIGFLFCIKRIHYTKKSKPFAATESFIENPIEESIEPKEKPTENKYIGSSTTMKLHKDSCRYVKLISYKNKTFFQSEQKALDQGYNKCVCLK